MTFQFDPYHKWLGIPQEEQPPDHYRLLGIARFEADPDVIDAAFYRQTAHVRTYQLGPHSDLSQKLLNKIAAAKLCLLDPEKKAAYDGNLRAALAPPVTEPATPPATTGLTPPHPPEPPVATCEEPLASNRAIPWPTPLRRTTGRRRTTKSPFIETLKIILGGVAGLFVTYCALLFVFKIDMLDRLSGPQATKSQQTSERPAIQWSDAQMEDTGTEATPNAPAARRPPRPNNEPAAQDEKALRRTDGTPRLAIAPFDAQRAKQHQTAWAAHLGVPVEFKNSIGMEFVLIPPGEFMMGSTEAEVARLLADAKATDQPNWYIDRLSDETPKHRVRITQPFWLGRHEVTRGQFSRFVNEAKYQTEAERDGEGGFGPVDGEWKQDPGFAWNADLGFEETDKHPVRSLTWNDATAFCEWLSLQESEKYRLPTEAEWEYTCRAGTTTRWYGTDDEVALQDYAWFKVNAWTRTHPVGQRLPNAWGLYDMHGNVWEWCQDVYDPEYYVNSPIDDPQGAKEGRERVFRGGAGRLTEPRVLRSAFRRTMPPRFTDIQMGFRVVREMESAISDHLPDLSTSLPRDARFTLPEASHLSAPSVDTMNTQPATSTVPDATSEIDGQLSIATTADDSASAIKLDADKQEKSERSPLSKESSPPLAVSPFDERTARQHQATWAEYLGVPGEFKNSIGMDFVLIPPGEFLMGSTDSDGTSRSGEKPQHQVRLTKPFYLGAYEVMQGEYEQVMGDNPSQFKGDRHLPVESVSWKEAMEFCRRLSALSEEQSGGWLYRLPTEAEWEYASRAGTTTIYSFGDSATSLGDYAWYSGNSIKKTHPVGQKKPDVWGLYDMHGNVSEWCTDWWDADNYSNSPVNDPVGLDTGSARVYRGGSWRSTARGCRSAHRGGALPAYRGDDLGFRLAYSPVE